MSIKINGTELGNQISLNNTNLSEIKLNGTSVWKSRIMLKKLPVGYLGKIKATIIKNELYIIYDISNEESTILYKFNNNHWDKISVLPSRVSISNADVVVLNDELHILGGYGSSQNKKHYKWNGTSWISVSTLPFTPFMQYNLITIYVYFVTPQMATNMIQLLNGTVHHGR